MKTCTFCRETKPFSEFNRSTSRKDGLQNGCRECCRTRSREYYATHQDRQRQQIRSANNRRLRETQDWYCEYLSQHPCIDCGEGDIVVLDADHLGEKVANVTTMIQQGYSLTKLKEELAKCEIVCANCHRRRTARRGSFYRHAWANARP